MIFNFGKNKNKEEKIEVIKEPEIHWNQVKSSFVEAIAYDNDKHDLYTTLTHGSYIYHGVPIEIFEQFLDASSHGSYFNRKIKDVYVFSMR